MKKLLTLFIFLYSSNFFAQTRFVTEYNSFGNYDVKGKKFYVLSGDPEIDSNDLEFKYYKDFITQILIRNKAIPTNDCNAADMCVFFDYHLADASYQDFVAVPVWGPTGVSSITTTTTTKSNAYGNANAYGYGNSVSASGNIYGSSTTNSTQSFTYNYGITGIQQAAVNVTKYYRVLNLYAYDNKSREGEPTMLWKINAGSGGANNDLSVVIPHMAEAIINGIGKTSNGRNKVSVVGNDAEVLAMKAGLYLRENAIVNPINYNKSTLNGILLRCVLLDYSSTILIFMCSKMGAKSLKFLKNTYIIYKDKRYPVDGVGISKNYEMLGKKIPLYDDHTQIALTFPIYMHKGDTFDFVAYKDVKETKELFSIKNIVLE